MWPGDGGSRYEQPSHGGGCVAPPPESLAERPGLAKTRNSVAYELRYSLPEKGTRLFSQAFGAATENPEKRVLLFMPDCDQCTMRGVDRTILSRRDRIRLTYVTRDPEERFARANADIVLDGDATIVLNNDSFETSLLFSAAPLFVLIDPESKILDLQQPNEPMAQSLEKLSRQLYETQ